MFIVKCPSKRGKNVRGVYDRNATCGHILGFFQNVSRETIIQCPSCKAWYKIVLTPEENSIQLIEKESLDFAKEIVPKILSYRIL